MAGHVATRRGQMRAKLRGRAKRVIPRQGGMASGPFASHQQTKAVTALERVHISVREAVEDGAILYWEDEAKWLRNEREKGGEKEVWADVGDDPFQRPGESSWLQGKNVHQQRRA